MKKPQLDLRTLGRVALICSLISCPAEMATAQTIGSWNSDTNNASWSDVSKWSGGIVPNGVDHIAEFNFQIGGNRTINIDSGVSSKVTLGGLKLGDVSGGSGYTIASGTLVFEASSGNAFITKLNKGGNDTISSTIQLNSAVDIEVQDTNGNSQGIIFSGQVIGGTTNVPVINFSAVNDDAVVRWLLINRNTNNFAGQIVINSGLLRLEGGARNTSSNTFGANAAGLRGVGNETIINNGGRVDLRDSDYDVQADDTEIFSIAGAGPNNLGALVNTSSTGTLSHLILAEDATVGGYSTIELRPHLNAAGTASIAAVLDMGGNDFTKIGTNTFIIENADIQNNTGSVWNIHEGTLQFRNRGGLIGGAQIGGTDYGNNVNGMTFNVAYYPGTFDGTDLTNGSRTSDPFNPNRTNSDTSGNSVAAARVTFRTDWGTGNTHLANTKVTEIYDGLTINLNYGSLVREGNTEAGRTFDHIFTPTTTINLVGGGTRENIFNMGGGSGGYNSAIGAYDHPGVTEIQGQIDNTSAGNDGDGFTKRGNRELRLTNSNQNFNGDVLVKQNTGRFMPPQYSTSSPTGAPESQYFSMSLAGADGGLNQASSITLTRWGSLALLNNSTNSVYSSVNNNDRLNDNGLLNLRNGFLVLETDAFDANTENFGNVVADLGTNYLYLDTRAGGQFDGSFETLDFNNGGVLKIYNMNDSHVWGTGATDDRLKVNNTTGLGLVGADNPGSNTQRVVPGLFGGTIPTFAATIGLTVPRTNYTIQNAYAYGGSGIGLMTLDNGYLRPLTASEYSVGGTPAANSNWLVDRYIEAGNASDRNNYADRNITSDITINSLTIAFNADTSGLAVPVAARDYVIIEPGKTLTINSGIINFASFVESTSANAEAVIRGGSLDMNGQAAIVNSALTRHDLDSTSGSFTTFMPGNNAFIRSNIINATDFIKTGRNNLYLETWNEISGNVYIGEQAGLYVRHPNALGEGAPGREVVIGGAGNFYLEYGTNIKGINLRVSNSLDTSRTVLRAEGSTHSTWGGDVIMDIADQAGSGEFQASVITARNNGTLTIYGNIYTDNNANYTDNDTWNDPAVLSTSIGERATINLKGQVRDTVDGPLANVGATGDSATRLDRNHSMVFQMRGHDEVNVNAYQQWNATGSIFATQGYFRIMYDPNASGLDGVGFHTDAARAGITQDNQWNQMWLGGPQNFLGIANSSSNAYNGHVFLTQADQVLNYADRIYVSNNNRNHTLTLGGEHTSGTAYIGSVDNSTSYRILFQNSNTERDLRFLQVRGGTLVVNARLEDGNSTSDSFNSTVSMVGPGTVLFNRNGAGSSTVDRWNFMAGTAIWNDMTGNNQFARTRGTSSNAIGSVSTWGGGNLVLSAQASSRTQTLDGSIYLLNGASSATVNPNTILALGSTSSGRTFNRRSGSSLAFLENGNGSITLTAPGVTTSAGEFLGAWAVYGNSLDSVTDWAGRQSTNGIQAFTGYDDDSFGSSSHTNLTTSVALNADAETSTVRFAEAVNLNIDSGFKLTLNQGGIMVPGTVTGNVNITGGSLTSTWAAGNNDLMLYNYGQGTTTIGSVLTDDGASRVNLVHAGTGTTVLTADNTLTGEIYLNSGVIQISSDSQLGQVNGSLSRIVLVSAGSSYSNNTTGNAVSFSGGGAGSGGTATFNTSSNSTASSRVVNNITVTNGGSGYNNGIYVTLNDGTASNASAWAVLDSGNLHFDGGVLHVTETMSLNAARTIFLGGNGGTLRVDPGKELTFDGFISSEYNHVYSANGYTQSNSFGNAWDAAYVRNPDIGDLIIDGGGKVVLTGAPDGTVRGNMYNAYGGITWINEGFLSLATAGSSAGAGILGTHNSRVDGTVIGPDGTLELRTTSDATIQEWFTLNGTGYQDAGTFRSLGTARVYRLSGQVEILSDARFQIMNGSDFRINESGGDFIGSGDVIRVGNGNFRFYGNNPDWTGRFVSASGTSYVSSAGNLQGMTGMVLERNSLFIYSAGSTSLDEFRNRLPDNLPITADGYGRLRMDSTGGIHSGIEKVGTITVAEGVLGIEFNLGADIASSQPRLQGDYGGWHFDEIVRTAGSTVHLRNFDAGTDFAGADFSTGTVNDRAVVKVDVAPTMVGSGDGTNGNAPIVPGFFGGTRTALIASMNATSVTGGSTQRYDEAYTANRLVTVDTDGSGQHYLRPLKDSEYKTVANPGDDAVTSSSVSLDDQGLSADQNLRIVGRDADSLDSNQFGATRKNSILTLNRNQTVNSVTFNSDTYVRNTAANPSGSSTFGGDYTALHVGNGTTMTVASGMIQTANFGVLDRGGSLTNSSNANLDLRSQINGGKLDFGGQEAQIYVGGFFNRYNTSTQVNGYESIDGDNTTLTISSDIVNTNGLVKTGPGALLLTGNNSYTGDTYVNHGSLYARSDYALGQSQNVYLSGGGSMIVSNAVTVSGVDLHVGKISGNNLAMALEQGATWGGNIILDNVDSAGATAYTRNFIPRIYTNNTNIGTILGDIYGGSTATSQGLGSESRIFTTYTGAGGILDFKGSIRDNAAGAVNSPLTSANQNDVLRMEVIATTNEANVQLWQQYDSAGQIILKRGYLRYSGTGDFYTTAAAATLNPDNPMSGFHMGGRGLIASGSGDGQTTSNLAFVLANQGSTFNLSSWTVGGDVTDPENLFASNNWGTGNTTGNSMIGGENRSGEVVFGTGTGSIKFTPYTSLANRDLRLYSAPGGEVTIRANFVDGGTAANPVNTSITKIGAGQVNLHGSSAGAGSVESVNVLGGLLVLENYDVNPDRRIGANASLLMGGGILALGDAGVENFGGLTLNAGGSALASIGSGLLDITSISTRNDGATLHFQSIAGGTIRIGGLSDGTRLGSYATFGAALTSTPTVTDWAAVNASGDIIAFAGYSNDTLGAGLHTDLLGSAVAAGETESVRFNTPGAAFGSGSLTVNDGGLLFTSNYTGGTAITNGVTVTAAGGNDLILHNYASGDVNIAGNITGNQNLVFTGTGTTVLSGTNSYAGTTYITGAATLAMDGIGRLGTGNLHMNGGTLNLTGTGSETLSSNITLGSGDGTLALDDAGKTLVLRGVISSEANPVASITTNPNSGGLRITGAGTVQFGARTDGSSLVGVANTYTGLTILGDGTNALNISLQGGGGNNTQHTPFGTTDSWTDGTIVRNNVTIELAPQYSSGAGNDQVRYREWFQFGEEAGDQIYIRHTTQRQISFDGFYNLVGDLNIHTQNAGLTNGGTSNRDFYMNVNEGGFFGAGNIVKTGSGNLYLMNSMLDWTGDLDHREGLVIQNTYPGAPLESTGMILLGDPAGNSTTTTQYRVQTRYGNSTTALDSGRQRIIIPRDISVRDNLKQEIRIGASYSSEIQLEYTGDIYLGSGSTGGGDSSGRVRFYYEDTTGYDATLVGHQQHALLMFTGNLSGSNNLMLDANEGGGANDDANDQFVTFLFSGDNSGFTGKLTIGAELGVGSGNFDRDDNDIFRAGSDKALSAANDVEMRNGTTLQTGGSNLTIGGLISSDGVSTSGLYSFTSPSWDSTRQTTADMDIDGTNLPVGRSTAIIENASATPGTLNITQVGEVVWDVYFRDGTPSEVLEDRSLPGASLSLEKSGSGTAILSIFNDYTGTTTVTEGNLQVGQGGTGEWMVVTQGNISVATTGINSNRAFGSTGTGQTTVMAGAMLSGSGHVRGDLVVNGTLAPGDIVSGVGGAGMSTLYIGDGYEGSLTINPGAVLNMQIKIPSASDAELSAGNFKINGPDYELYIDYLKDFNPGKAAPTYFGEIGSHISTDIHDHLEISGGLTWNGDRIEVVDVAGFNPQAGDIYNLFDWYGVSDWGSFNTGSSRYLVGNGDDNGDLWLPDLSAHPDLRWDTGLFTSDGILVISNIVLVPEPSRMMLLLVGLVFVCFRRRR